MAASVFFSFVLMTSSIILILIRVIGLALYPAQWGRVLSIDQSYISIHGPLHLAMCLYIPIAYASVVTLQRTDLSSSLYSDRTNSIVEQLMGLKYRRRYKRAPPPGFDAWYRYAVERSSVIIDDFDNLMDDLQLFWALSPAEIRKRTHEACGDWSEVALLTIRSGKAEIGPDVKPTHRWMLDGVIAMMSNYVDKIPDMDLGFNINDEPRIATPYKDLQILRRSSTITEPLKGPFINEFSHERAQGWNISTDDPNYNSNPFTDQSFLNSFHTYSSISCPPSSPARRSHHWDTRTLCTTCAAPHSKGIFLSNWTLSASPCHQPDLAHLHGFYLSPAAFKPSHTLYPIFSQSKASGYADIRYPSPWNYIDKAVYAPSSNASSPFYDPPWAEKKNIMFWRGATSEGLSRFGEWKGMARQRLVHLANNHSTSTNLPIFLPNPGSPATFSIHPIPASLLPHLGLNITSIHLVEKIDRCWDADCTTQKGEFGLAGKSNFQSHWQYKYLIDLDGAGFSGRFIPFLQSRSLVFKVAGVFREWWDDGRVVAWRHFVPVDVRFQGFWSTVAFFAGTRGVGGAGGGKEGGTGKSGGGTKGVHVGAWKGREEEGERIAREGAEWVRKVMRKEDMEIYFYRLLLEWGRLTDDRRDELGFIG
ncbi:MAG: hypothetical protein L6R41_006366 [Letrouitia leprolyta]|nr:MAG: hypothetical protein L6R41_006366 [Letrouitia leprolyta]